MRTTERLTIEPFDVERLTRGEALAGVTTPDGRFVVGRLHTDEVFIATGDRTTTQRTDAANRRRRTQHVNAMALVLDMTEEGQSNREIAAALVARGLMDATPRSQIRRVQTLRAEARAFFGG